MNRPIARVTVIRGKGDKAVVNGVVSKEFERLRAMDREQFAEERRAFQNELTRLGIIEASHSKMLTQRLREIEQALKPKRERVIVRVYERLFAYGVCFAKGLVVREYD